MIEKMPTNNEVDKPFSNEQSKEKESMEKRTEEWEKMAKEVETWTDAKGKGIENGIKEAVIGFNLLGLTTEQSCEGHSDEWGMPYPWISFSALGRPKERFVGEVKAFEKAAENKGISFDFDAPYHGFEEEDYWAIEKDVVNNDETEEYKKWVEQNKRLREKTAKAVELFNTTHNLPENLKLRVSEFAADGFEISSVDDETRRRFNVEEADVKEREQCVAELPKRQAEMRALADWIKSNFINGDLTVEQLEAISDEE